ncbi:MAG TPA: diguanylate cyclase [Gemmatimonadaceae bacterium]
MDSSPTNVLLISENPADVAHLNGALAFGQRAGSASFALMEAPLPPAEGLSRLGRGGVDILLLDVRSAFEGALDTLVRARIEAPEIPVVLLTPEGQQWEALGTQAVEAGAQDVVCSERLERGTLARVMRYAIERQRLHATLRHLSLTDELTGLYNRRGFIALCEHHLHLAPRTRGLLVAAADVSGLGRINDRFGRDEGDRAIVSAANVLRATFRASDVVARLGGDDFAVLVLDAADATAEVVAPRLRARLTSHNARATDRPYRLTISMGVARFDPRLVTGAEIILAHAARALAEQKRAR